MFEGLAKEVALKAKARTGASGELAVWIGVIAIFSAIAIVFFSIALYIWLAGLYGGVIAGSSIGGACFLLAVIACARCAVLRRRTKARALVEMKIAEQQTPWWSDPSVLAMGYQLRR
jgi:hypothetical protein